MRVTSMSRDITEPHNIWLQATAGGRIGAVADDRRSPAAPEPER
jgi:hypothetical protein